MKPARHIMGLVLYASFAVAISTTAALAATPDNATLQAQFNAAMGDPAARIKVLGSIMAPEVAYYHNYGLPDDGVPKPREVIIRTQGGGRTANSPPFPYKADQEEAYVSDGAITLNWRLTSLTPGPDGKPLSTLYAQIWKRNKDGLIVSGTVYYDPAQQNAVMNRKPPAP